MSNENIQRRGLMLVLSSPSGAGKTTLSRRLLESDGNINLSVSATTRPMRPGEVHDKDYHFLSNEEFDAWLADGKFLEHATVFGNRYGTPSHLVNEVLAAGCDVLFDIDWQGTQQLREKKRDDLVSIFILPPSHDELERRLRNRAQDSEDVVQSRMAKANNEISHWAEYDYVVINDDLDSTLNKIRTILDAERMKRGRQTGIAEFARKLMD
jgi:guanylate kinase